MAPELESLVNEFLAVWSAGQRPDIAEFLERVDEADRDELLTRLLPIDIQQRLRAGDGIVADDYASFGSAAIAIAKQNLSDLDSQSDGSYALTQALSGDAPLPSTTTSAEPQPIPKQIGPYKLLQQIGEGGMGTVWMAEQEKPLRRRVALKLIKSGMDSKQIVARFEAERQALAMMDHQNIARVLDAGISDDGTPYFAMELVQGMPITKYCDREKLSIADRLQLFVQVCRAIQHAHQKGIIHRDLKPSNVLVTQRDGVPVAKVIDFGLAKALQSEHRLTDKTLFTQFGQVVGTLEYMSPEQAEMNELGLDTRTDVYSLGVLLYELLTGSTPLGHERVRKEAYHRLLELILSEDDPASESAFERFGRCDQRDFRTTSD